MDIKEFSSKMIELEDKYNVYQERLQNLYIWPFLRIQYYLFFKKAQLAKGGEETSLLKRVRFVLQSLKPIFQYIIGSRHTNIILTNSSFRTKVNKLHYDRIIDPVKIKNRENDYQVYEFSHNYKYNIPAFEESKVSRIQLLFLLITKMSKNRVKTSIPPTVTALTEELVDFFPSLSKYLSPINVRKTIDKHLIFIEAWKKIICRKRIQKAYINCYYDSKGLSFLSAANELGVEVIDLQHGIQGEYHLAYSNWNKFPQEVRDKSLPNEFLVWNQDSYNNLFKQGLNVNNIGYGWIDLWTHGWFHFDVKLSDRIILYSLQPVEDPFPEYLVKLLSEFGQKYSVFIRLHPSQIDQIDWYEAEFLKLGMKANFNIREASNLPLPAILTHTVLHITKWSTVAIEAANFNVPTYFTSQNGLDIFLDNIERDLIIKDYSTCQEFLSNL